MSTVLEHPILKRKAVPATASMEQAMAELNILPFTDESVKRYKNKIAWRCFFGSWRFWIQEAGLWSFFVTGVLSLLFLVSAAFVHAFFGSGRSASIVALYWMLAMLASGLTGMLAHGKRGARQLVPKWTLSPGSIHFLRSYQGLPEFAQQTALEIREKCPDARFAVETLYINKVERDPFLIVQDGLSGPAYYVEVWGEPDYKRIYQ